MYQQIINEICHELNIKCTYLSNNWIIMLEKDNQIKYICGYKFDLNHTASSLVIDDKYAMYCVLKANNLPVIEHRILYDESNKEIYAKNLKNRSIAYNYLKNNDNNIVIKSNNGTCGKEVYHVTSKLEIDKILDKLFKNNQSISLCPFYQIEDEYRVIILNHIPKLIYRKVRPIVTGDGHKLISELLKEFNPTYNYKVPDDKILSKETTYTYSWMHNLSRGSTINTTVENHELIEKIAIKVANTLNLKFGSIDIIKVKDKYMVLECNSGVMMDNLIKILPNGYDIAKKIYQEAIENMFDD